MNTGPGATQGMPGPQAPVPMPTAPAPPPVEPTPAPPPAPKKGEPGYVAPPGTKAGPTLPAGMPPPAGLSLGPAGDTDTGVLGGKEKTFVGTAGAAALPGQPAAPAPTPTAPVPAAIPVPNMDAFNGTIGTVNKAIDGINAKWKSFVDTLNAAMGAATGAINNFVNGALAQLNGAAAQAKVAGTHFSNGFADGIQDPAALARIAAAAQKAAKTAADYMPHSPAKKGPLSGDGWTGFSGQAFAGDFADGIMKGVSNISNSAKTAAEAAKIVFGGLTKGAPKNDNYLKQLKDLTNFASNAFKVFNNVSSTGLKFLDFLSNPTKAKGMFFGSPLPFARDAKVSDQQVQDNMSKAAQQAFQGPEGQAAAMRGGAQSLAGIKAPTQDDIAAAIAGEAQSRGYDRNTAIGAIAAAMHESNMQPGIVNASGHVGLWQMDAGYPNRNAGAAGQIGDFFDRLDKLGGPSAAAGDPLDFIATQLEKGGYTGQALAQHAQAAASLYDKVQSNIAGLPAGTAGLAAGTGSLASQVPIAPTVEAGIRQMGLTPLYTPGTTQLPAWTQQLAQAYGLTANTYPTGGSLHQMGFAMDFNGPAEGREQLAQYISGALKGQTLQLIYQSPLTGQKYGIAGGQDVGPGTSQPDYYNNDFGQHTDHIHWATDVAPTLSAANAAALPGAADGDTQKQTLAALRSNNSSLDEAIKTGQNPNSTDQQVAASLGTITTEISKQNDPNSTQAKALGQVRDQIASNRGMAQQESPVGATQNALGQVSSIANDVIQDINSGLDAVAGTKDIGDVLVRGMANTEDVNRVIDDFQKYLTFAANIAQTVGDVASEVGQVAAVANAGEPGGGGGQAAAGAVSAIASAISGALQGVNETIDLLQEAWHIFGSYYGQFLGYLLGGPQGLQGNVEMLLDQNTGQLLAYSTDNPQQKTGHNVPGETYNPTAENQAIGQINVYGGPGIDPRDTTRQMLYQVKAAGYSMATAQ
jgi:hypothetical protein